jgi:exopolyphosphatase/pppGpp-phosphohydrolase
MTQKMRVSDGAIRKADLYDAINYFEMLDMVTAIKQLQRYQSATFQ